MTTVVRTTGEPNCGRRYPVGVNDSQRPLSALPSPTARALAFMNGRGFVTPQDVKDMAADVLRHRILLSYEAEAEEVSADSIVERIMSKVPVP